MSIEEVVESRRFDILMGLVFLVFIGALSFTGLLGALLNVFIWAAVLVATVLAYIASKFAPPEPAEKSSWFVELLIASFTVAMFYALLSRAPGLFYGMTLAFSALMVVLAKPKFGPTTGATSTGLGVGVASFVIVFLLSSLLYVFSLTSITAALPALSIMQIEGPLMLLLVAIPEEMWARAMMYSALKKYVGARTAAFWSFFWFIVMHIPSRVQSLVDLVLLPVIIGLISIAILPIFYVYVKYQEHPLFSIMAHTTYNTLILGSQSFLGMIGAVVGLAAVYYVIKGYERGGGR